MKKLIQIVSTTTSAVFILFGLILVNHVSAMPSDVHDPNMKVHSARANGESKCVSQCTNSAPGKKQDELNLEQDNEDDDHPITPYYAAYLTPSYDYSSRLASIKSKQSLRPPPKVPIYISLGVFRV